MSNSDNSNSEIRIGPDRIAIKGGAYEDLRPLVRGAVGVATPFVECVSLLTGLSVGWVNRKLKKIADRYEGKLELIPEDRRCLPALEIAATAMRGAAISAEAEVLQELFAELLAAASDTERTEFPHPSFGSVISELEPMDAKVIALFRTIGRRDQLYLREVCRDLGLEPLDKEIAVSLSNLKRQGLVERSRRRSLSSFSRRFTYRTDTESMLRMLREEISDEFKELTEEEWPIQVTPFGKRFIAACIPVAGLESA